MRYSFLQVYAYEIICNASKRKKIKRAESVQYVNKSKLLRGNDYVRADNSFSNKYDFVLAQKIIADNTKKYNGCVSEFDKREHYCESQMA